MRVRRADTLGYFLSRGHLHNQQTQRRKLGEWKLRWARRQNTEESSSNEIDDESCFSLKLGGIVTWAVFRGIAQRICCSLIVDTLYYLSVHALSLTSNTCINVSLNQYVLFTIKRLNKASSHKWNGKTVFNSWAVRHKDFQKRKTCGFVFEKWVFVDFRQKTWL